MPKPNRKTKPLQVTIKREKRLAKLEECILQGHRSQAQLASKFGVSLGLISQDLEVIYKRLREETRQNRGWKRAQAVAEYRYIKKKALHDYELSKVFIKKCGNCKDGRRADGIDCEECDASGLLRIEVPGDPAFLKIAIDCTDKVVKVEGLEPPKRVEGKVSGEITTNNRHHLAVEGNPYLGLPNELIIDAMRVFNSIDTAVGVGEADDVKVIEGNVVKPHNGDE